MKMKTGLLTLLLAAVIGYAGQAQENESGKTPESVTMVFPAFNFQWPGGDLADRFGASSTIGPGFMHKTSKNWIIGADINFIFGNRLREDSLIQNLINSDGFVISDQGHYAEVSFFERGFYSSFRIGKVIPVFGSNENSGLLIMAGAGYLQHKINIKVKENSAAQLRGDYLKGYDRLTDGFCTNLFVGYMYMGNTRLANFFVGMEMVQAWTQNRRSMNFDTMRRDDKKRFDMLNGIRIGWIIPFNKREPDEYYYY